MTSPSINGHLILIMAPSGSGKGHLVSYVREHFKDKIVFAVSCTTRAPRPGEVDGETYYFLTPEVFQEKIANGEFLEWAEFGGHQYGTLKSEILTPLQHGKIVLREVELQGVEAIRTLIPVHNRTVVFIDGGSWDLLAKRITARAPISEQELELRRIRYEAESLAKPHADIVINNEDGRVQDAEQTLVNLIANIITQTVQ